MEDFLKVYFPELTVRPKASAKYYQERGYWLQYFQKYMQQNPHTTNITYNQNREQGTPSWQMIATMNYVKRWNELLELCQLPVHRVCIRHL